MDDKVTTFNTLMTIGGAGLLTGLGQLLVSDEKLTARLVAGRAVATASLGMSSLVILAWIPDIPSAALVGLACLLGNLGTSGLERVLQKALGVRP